MNLSTSWEKHRLNVKTFLKERLMQPDATLKFIVQDHSPSVPTYGSTQQHTSLGSIHAIKGHMVKWYHMCVQLGQGFHQQAKHFNSTTPPQHQNTTPVGFEPTRGDPIGLAGRRLSRSAKVSSAHRCQAEILQLGLVNSSVDPSSSHKG